MLSYKILHNVSGLTSGPYLKSKAEELQADIKQFIDYQFHTDQDIDLLKRHAFDLYKKIDNFK